MRLYVTDLDGTLLNSQSRVSRQSAQIISALAARGVNITVATARTPATVEPLLRECNLKIPAIVMTGAAMWSRDGNSYHNVRFLSESLARKVLSTCQAEGVNPFVYTLPDGDIIHTFFNGTPTNRERKFIEERNHLPLKRFVYNSPTRMERLLDRVVLIFATGNAEAIYRCGERLRAETDCYVSAYPDIFSHSNAYLEVFAPGVSKASAIQELAKEIGADEIIVFGDNLNDIPMMQIADRSVAVANAFDEVKMAADVVIDNNDSDAVARYIKANEGFQEI